MKKLGKIITKKIKAYPRQDEQTPYVTSFCYLCDDEYLTQNLEREEHKDKCPECKDKHFCFSCDEIFDVDELKEVDVDEYYCEDCYQPTCIACNEPVEEEGMACSSYCVGVWKWDNRDKTLE